MPENVLPLTKGLLQAPGGLLIPLLSQEVTVEVQLSHTWGISSSLKGVSALVKLWPGHGLLLLHVWETGGEMADGQALSPYCAIFLEAGRCHVASKQD